MLCVNGLNGNYAVVDCLVIIAATDNEGIPCTGGRLSPAAENTAREDTRPPASDTRINPVRHNKKSAGQRDIGCPGCLKVP